MVPILAPYFNRSARCNGKAGDKLHSPEDSVQHGPARETDRAIFLFDHPSMHQLLKIEPIA
ncbi:hypothetical protein CCR96_01740 [Halochromatium roseum]|nr:hypothetical protein [Halochromatium roseum]